MLGKCEFCKQKIKVIDYKNVELLEKYITPRKKIKTRRQTGLCAYHQRKLAKAIKKARNAALLAPVKLSYT